MNVREAMTPEPYTAQVTASARQAARILDEADVRHVPVVEDGRLVGIISDRDLRRLTTPALEKLEQPEHSERLWSQPISTLMSSDVLCVEPEDDLGEAIDLMIEHRVGALPVVEPGSSQVVGIISYVDVLRAARDVL